MRDSDTEILVGVYRGIVNADFIVEMRTGRASAGANVSNHIAPVYRLTCSYGIAGKVAVASADAVAVIDHDGLAVAAHELAAGDDSVGRGKNLGAIAAANIHAAVEGNFPVKR